jgi:hypothetical protein
MNKFVYEMKGISSPVKLEMKNREKLNSIEIKISAQETNNIFAIVCSLY